MFDQPAPEYSAHQRMIIGAVLHQPGIGRSEIAKQLNISAQTAMRAILPLVDGGVLRENQAIRGQRGKPARKLDVIGENLVTLGISLASDRIRVDYCDLTGRSLASESISQNFDSAGTQCQILDTLLDKAEGNLPLSSSLIGVGVSVQGYFLTPGNRFASRADPSGWANIDLGNVLEQRFGVQVTILNDGSALANSLLREAPYSDFLCIHIGTGIGGGVISAGRLVSGASGNAGEVGSLFPDSPDRPVEAAFLRHANITNWQNWPGIENLTDPQDFDKWLRRAAANIGDVIGQALALLDFEAVYICSRMPHDLLSKLCSFVDAPTIGSSLIEAGIISKELTNPTPKILPYHVPYYSRLANNIALQKFVAPSETGRAASNPTLDRE